MTLNQIGAKLLVAASIAWMVYTGVGMTAGYDSKLYWAAVLTLSVGGYAFTKRWNEVGASV